MEPECLVWEHWFDLTFGQSLCAITTIMQHMVEHSIVLLCKLHIVKGVIVTSNVPRAVNMEGRCLSKLHLDTVTPDWQLPVFIAHSFPGDITCTLRCWSWIVNTYAVLLMAITMFMLWSLCDITLRCWSWILPVNTYALRSIVDGINNVYVVTIWVMLWMLPQQPDDVSNSVMTQLWFSSGLSP